MWGKDLTIQILGYIEGTVLRGAFSLNSSPNSFSAWKFAVHCRARSDYRKKTTTWFSTSAAASGQEILQHMLVCSSLLFLLDCFFFFVPTRKWTLFKPIYISYRNIVNILA